MAHAPTLESGQRPGAATLDLIRRLIAFDTVSERSNLALIDFLAKSLTGANATGKVSFGTEGGLFQESGMPAVICGPGSIAVAHRANEYIELDQVALCETWLGRGNSDSTAVPRTPQTSHNIFHITKLKPSFTSPTLHLRI